VTRRRCEKRSRLRPARVLHHHHHRITLHITAFACFVIQYSTYPVAMASSSSSSSPLQQSPPPPPPSSSPSAGRSNNNNNNPVVFVPNSAEAGAAAPPPPPPLEQDDGVVVAVVAASAAAVPSSVSVLVAAEEAQTPPRRLNLSRRRSGGTTTSSEREPSSSSSTAEEEEEASSSEEEEAAAAGTITTATTTTATTTKAAAVVADAPRHPELLQLPPRTIGPDGGDRGNGGATTTRRKGGGEKDDDGGADDEEKKDDRDDGTAAGGVFERDDENGNDDAASHRLQLRGYFEDLKLQLNEQVEEAKERSRIQTELLLNALQQESLKRSALERSFHNQLLLQSEATVAMELKLLRLESKIKEQSCSSSSTQQQQHSVSVNRYNNNQQIQPSSLQQQRPISASTSSWRAGIGANPTPRIASEISNSVILEEEGIRQEQRPQHHHHHHRLRRDDTAEGMSVFTSAASLASGVTLDQSADDGEEEEDDDEISPVVTINDSDSTPTTVGSRRIAFGNLESILLNPMVGDAAATPAELSTRAVRGDATSVSSGGSWATRSTATGSTIASTVLTSATRGAESLVHVRQMVEVPEEEGIVDGQHQQSTIPEGSDSASSGTGRISRPESEGSSGGEVPRSIPRSRSNSPLTVQDNTTVGSGEATSVASANASIDTSILSNMAAFRLRHGHHPRGSAASASAGRPSMANRVVSFTPDIVAEASGGPMSSHPGGGQYVVGGGTIGMVGGGGGGGSSTGYNEPGGANDSITMPDELDNLSQSELADSLVTSVRLWREEYEARLDALQKRWPTE